MAPRSLTFVNQVGRLGIEGPEAGRHRLGGLAGWFSGPATWKNIEPSVPVLERQFENVCSKGEGPDLKKTPQESNNLPWLQPSEAGAIIAQSSVNVQKTGGGFWARSGSARLSGVETETWRSFLLESHLPR